MEQISFYSMKVLTSSNKNPSYKQNFKETNISIYILQITIYLQNQQVQTKAILQQTLQKELPWPPHPLQFTPM